LVTATADEPRPRSEDQGVALNHEEELLSEVGVCLPVSSFETLEGRNGVAYLSAARPRFASHHARASLARVAG
jgi:hypothetical protein